MAATSWILSKYSRQRMKRFYTPARQRFLISLLLNNEQKVFGSDLWADIPFGTMRVSAWARPMLGPLQKRGIIEWGYAKCYTAKDLFDVTLTEKGYRIAAKCLLWIHRKDLTGYGSKTWYHTLRHPG